MKSITDPIDFVNPRMEELRSIIKQKINSIMANREEILTAFVAKWGYEPDEIEQVEQIDGNEIRWFIRKRKTT